MRSGVHACFACFRRGRVQRMRRCHTARSTFMECKNYSRRREFSCLFRVHRLPCTLQQPCVPYFGFFPMHLRFLDFLLTTFEILFRNLAYFQFLFLFTFWRNRLNVIVSEISDIFNFFSLFFLFIFFKEVYLIKCVLRFPIFCGKFPLLLNLGS